MSSIEQQTWFQKTTISFIFFLSSEEQDCYLGIPVVVATIDGLDVSYVTGAEFFIYQRTALVERDAATAKSSWSFAFDAVGILSWFFHYFEDNWIEIKIEKINWIKKNNEQNVAALTQMPPNDKQTRLKVNIR